jgi:flagellar protein FlaG
MLTNIQPKAPIPPTSGVSAPIAPAQGTVRAEPTVAATEPVPQAEIRINTEELKQNIDQAIRQLNDDMRDGGRNIAFSIDEALGRPIILVKKQDTGEVVRQIPNETIVKMAHSLDKLKGLIFNRET